MSNLHSNRYVRDDHCPLCRERKGFLCCDYIIDGVVYLHEEQCPTCRDFYQVAVGEQGLVYSGGTEFSRIR